MSHETEALALHYNVPLALAALLLSACATTPNAEQCRIARADVAAGESCLAEPTCAAKWDSASFRMTVDNARDDVRRYCGGAK